MRPRLSGLFALIVSVAGAQTPPASTPPAAPPNAAEVASNDAPITFQSKVNLVLVPVVVRDKAGKTVDNLKKEDFQLFDKGKAQVISKFSIEKAGSKVIPPAPQLEKSLDETTDAAPGLPMVIPTHFVAWFFDDIHLSFGDLVQARQAADKYLLENLDEKTRTAIYTTSGQTVLDFTDNYAQLHDTLAQLRPRPVSRSVMQECPDISYYMADMIVNKNDTIALRAADQETYACLNMAPPQTIKDAEPMAQAAANRALYGGEQETRIALLALKDLVRRMGAMPGTRLVVMVSPGFLRLNDQLQDESDIIDRAIKANVTIRALDARGLYTDMPDISRRIASTASLVQKQGYDRDAARASSDVMAELADATGGTFFQNNNDLAAGMKELSTVPSVYYVLAFSPQNLKLDGSYHNLKISLRTPAGLVVKGRRGYYAPRHLSDADEDAKEEISQALFSRDEMHDIPVDMHTQFFKSSADDAHLVVVSRLDVRKLHYRKADGRNGDEVLVVSGLFDRNGNFLQAVSKTIKMRLKDDTLAEKLNSGIAVRADFKIAPGRYVVRLVVRDAEGQMMAAQNGAVEIP
ncbi:MAG TPA: VWA domain-containing protein [Bryobacteraceae bacterium]|nr:VWA domain-containing protein [Bryobacteraceae bacterium]